MQENNFEGQVHYIMEGFTIDPSEKVWSKIQADISGQKKGRFGIFPFLMLTGCFLLATFFLHDLEKKQSVIAGAVSSSVNKTTQSVITATDLNKKQVVTISQKNKLQSSVSNELTEGLYKRKKLIGISKNKINNIIEPATVMDELRETNTEIGSESMKQDKETEPAIEDVFTVGGNKKDSTMQTVSVQKDLIKTDSAELKQKKEQERSDKATPFVKKKNNTKWEFFAIVSGGKFYTENSFLGLKANSDYLYSPTASTGSSNSSNGLFQPSRVKHGLSFTAALKASRKLSSKIVIAAGVGYQYAYTSVSTGQVLSGGLRDNFAAGSVNKFHNKYQYIQLPVEIQSMIGKGNKLPVYWNAGFVFSRLISADALQFDGNLGRYFKDNSYFNKNIIGISGGLSLAIFKKQKAQWLIGPQFYYSLTPVAGNGLYDKTHYSFLGLQLQKRL